MNNDSQIQFIDLDYFSNDCSQETYDLPVNEQIKQPNNPLA